MCNFLINKYYKYYSVLWFNIFKINIYMLLNVIKLWRQLEETLNPDYLHVCIIFMFYM